MASAAALIATKLECRKKPVLPSDRKRAKVKEAALEMGGERRGEGKQDFLWRHHVGAQNSFEQKSIEDLLYQKSTKDLLYRMVNRFIRLSFGRIRDQFECIKNRSQC